MMPYRSKDDKRSNEKKRDRNLGTHDRTGDTIIIGGLPIYKATRAAFAHQFLHDWQENKGKNNRPRFSTSANGHVLALAARDELFRSLLETADHIDADGMPLVIASRYWANQALPERIATTDFIHDVAKVAHGKPIRFFLLGSDRETNAAAVAVLRRLYPWLVVDGHHGYFNAESEANLVETINNFRPDLLWVGLGVPREHQFVLRYRDQLRGVTWLKTCGGLFNFLAGQRRRAPRILQNIGLEWAWRIMQEPVRLGPRYWATNGEALRLMWRYRVR